MRSHAASQQALVLLLESFARQQHYVPVGATPLRRADELPYAVQSEFEAGHPAWSWRAWHVDERVYCIAGHLITPPDADSDVLLEVHFYDMDGRIAAVGAWALLPDGRWHLRRIGSDVHDAQPAHPHLRVIS